MYIIFDFDGVIVDTEKGIFKFFQEELSKRGIHMPDSKLHEKVGNSSEKFLKTTTGLSDDEIRNLTTRRRNEFLSNLDMYVLIDGVREEIIRLSKHHKLALCSNGVRDLLISVVEHYGLSEYFEFILCAEDVKMLKPDPEIYNLAKSRFELLFHEKVDSNNSFIIEDSIIGITAGKSAGLKVVAITTSFSRDRLHDADYIIDNFKELKNIIQ